MTDHNYFLPDDLADASAQGSTEGLATPQQWASMTFAAIHLDPAKFGPGWDRARGAMARTVVALLRFDDQSLTRHFQAEPEPMRRALDVHAGLQQEIDYLKTHLEALEMASARMLCVASRCAEQ